MTVTHPSPRPFPRKRGEGEDCNLAGATGRTVRANDATGRIARGDGATGGAARTTAAGIDAARAADATDGAARTIDKTGSARGTWAASAKAKPRKIAARVDAAVMRDATGAAGTAGEPEVLELERFLPYRLSVLSNTVSQAIADSYQRRFGLAITEWRVMAVLGRFDGLSAREVAARTAMDKVAVSRAVARLIDAGHVRRLVADHDKRQSVLRLSGRGWKVYAQIAPLALDHERRLLAHLDADEQEWLGRILDKLWSAELEEIAR